MKRTILFFAACFAAASIASAQEKPAFNPDLAWNTLRAEVGVQFPLRSEVADGGLLYSLSYTKRILGHWGWRAGATYADKNTSVRNYVGAPLAAVYRFNTVSYGQRVRDVAVTSAHQVAWDSAMGYGSDKMTRDVLSNALFILFRGFEAFAGVTPGYVFGDGTTSRETYFTGSGPETYDVGIQLNRRFTLTADVGCSFSIPIRHISLNFSPAVHYLLTNNFTEYRQKIDPITASSPSQPTLRPLRWQASIMAGISYMF